MEGKGSTESGSPGSEAESPPVSSVGGEAVGGGGGGGGMVPQVMSFGMGMVGGGGGGGSGDLAVKKRRGRPRKYDSNGNLRVQYFVAEPPQALPAPPGFSLTSPTSDFSAKRGRGRPPGSGNWQLLASLGELFANTAGGDFTPHVLTVSTGEDVAAKILSLVQRGPRGICVLSANGAVSNVTIRQPGSSGGLLTYEGRFEILSLTGSFTMSENGGIKSRTGGLSVSLAGPDGRVIGGGIAGLLTAASPIQIVVGSFMPNGYKAHKRKHNHELKIVPAIPAAPEAVTPANPISQAAAYGGSAVPAPISQFPVQREADSSAGSKVNPSWTNAETARRTDSDAHLDQRPSPDINLSVSSE